MSTSSVTATLNSVCASSKHPKVAMQVLQLLNTDVEFYNTLSKGVEGKHWVWVDKSKNVIGPGPDVKNYNSIIEWEFGNTFNLYYTDPKLAAANANGFTKKINDTAPASVALGFTFNPEPVKNEIAQVTAVVKELGYPIGMGQVNPETSTPALLKKMKDAGMDKILVEVQKQLDQWAKTKK
jgi:putative aldouronate transport system substrate-binding protein